MHLTTLLSKVFSFSDSFGGQGRDGTGHMDRQTFLGKYYFRMVLSWVTISVTGFFFRGGGQSRVEVF